MAQFSFAQCFAILLSLSAISVHADADPHIKQNNEDCTDGETTTSSSVTEDCTEGIHDKHSTVSLTSDCTESYPTFTEAKYVSPSVVSTSPYESEVTIITKVSEGITISTTLPCDSNSGTDLTGSTTIVMRGTTYSNVPITTVETIVDDYTVVVTIPCSKCVESSLSEVAKTSSFEVNSLSSSSEYTPSTPVESFPAQSTSVPVKIPSSTESLTLSSSLLETSSIPESTVTTITHVSQGTTLFYTIPCSEASTFTPSVFVPPENTPSTPVESFPAQSTSVPVESSSSFGTATESYRYVTSVTPSGPVKVPTLLTSGSSSTSLTLTGSTTLILSGTTYSNVPVTTTETIVSGYTVIVTIPCSKCIEYSKTHTESTSLSSYLVESSTSFLSHVESYPGASSFTSSVQVKLPSSSSSFLGSSVTLSLSSSTSYLLTRVSETTLTTITTISGDRTSTFTIPCSTSEVVSISVSSNLTPSGGITVSSEVRLSESSSTSYGISSKSSSTILYTVPVSELSSFVPSTDSTSALSESTISVPESSSTPVEKPVTLTSDSSSAASSESSLVGTSVTGYESSSSSETVPESYFSTITTISEGTTILYTLPCSESSSFVPSTDSTSAPVESSNSLFSATTVSLSIPSIQTTISVPDNQINTITASGSTISVPTVPSVPLTTISTTNSEGQITYITSYAYKTIYASKKNLSSNFKDTTYTDEKSPMVTASNTETEVLPPSSSNEQSSTKETISVETVITMPVNIISSTNSEGQTTYITSYSYKTIYASKQQTSSVADSFSYTEFAPTAVSTSDFTSGSASGTFDFSSGVSSIVTSSVIHTSVSITTGGSVTNSSVSVSVSTTVCVDSEGLLCKGLASSSIENTSITSSLQTIYTSNSSVLVSNPTTSVSIYEGGADKLGFSAMCAVAGWLLLLL